MNNYINKNSLEYLFDEIEKNIKAHNYYSALLISLSIPDVLGLVKYPKLSSTIRYPKWFDENVKDVFGLLPNNSFYANWEVPRMNGLICYQLRCRLYHEGHNDINQKTGIDEFVLSMTDEEFVRGENAGSDVRYDDILKPTEIVEENKYLYVSCKGLASQIVKAAKEFIKNNPNLDYPTLRINYGGGRINELLYLK